MSSPLLLFFEWGMFKRQKHTGAALAGVPHPDSLADHTTRAAMIGFLLAHYEKADPYRTAVMLLFHDMAECRIGDQHKVAARYFSNKEAEQQAFWEQTENFPQGARQDVRNLFEEFEKRNTPEGIVGKDADWLEMAVSAREYIAQGYSGLQDWINNIRKALETKTAKKWLVKIEKTDPNEWWSGLKKMTYSKLSKNNSRAYLKNSF